MLDRHEQLVATGVAQLDELLHRPAVAPGGIGADVAETDERADAMVDMHDMVARLQIAEVGKERAGDRLLPSPDQVLVVKEIRLGVDLQPRIRQAEAARQQAGGDQHGRGRRRLRPLHPDPYQVVLGQ